METLIDAFYVCTQDFIEEIQEKALLKRKDTKF